MIGQCCGEARMDFNKGSPSKDPGPEDPALISPQRGVVIGFRYIVLVLVLVLVLVQNHASRTRTSTRTSWHARSGPGVNS